MYSTASSEAEDKKVTESAAKKPSPRSGKIKQIWKENREGWMFVAPLVIGLAIFTLYPMIQSLIWSFFNYTGAIYYYPVGLGNFRYMFATDPVFWKVLGNTVFYAFVSVPIVLVSSYLLATLVNLPYKSVGAFRVIYYLPCVIPGVVSGLLWKDMFAANGVFNQFLGLFGLHSQFFESESSWTAISSIFLMNMWSIGGGMILWLSAFKAIPVQLYEAAKIDGAGYWRQFTSFVIPLAKPAIMAQFIPTTGSIAILIVFLATLGNTGDITTKRIMMPLLGVMVAWKFRTPIGLGATTFAMVNGFAGDILAPEFQLQLLDPFLYAIVPSLCLTIYCIFCWKLMPKDNTAIDESKLKKQAQVELLPLNKQYIVYGVFVVVVVLMLFNLLNLRYLAPAIGVIILLFTGCLKVPEAVKPMTSDRIFAIFF